MVAGPATTTDGGITDTEVLIGQCAALTGPAEGLGTGIPNGRNTAFEEVNAKEVFTDAASGCWPTTVPVNPTRTWPAPRK